MRLSVRAKCSDMCHVVLIDDDGQTLKESCDYVPYNLGIGGGDYVDFDLDLNTMQILSYKVRQEDIDAFVSGEEC